ncbi:expressed unknown protein [Ectocarpus siliculosus]|uniref:Uncharacterized protein n=1 Tax=Ectocarpus siliculosus TaxID=2880 RepID=D7G8W7_ECTSI|nr:expressed unknown protein [Ectocarpus siliculosus]|eukprot:CBJ28135.1 expressed unknown protein [Ectocarpus siliculosus]
MEKSDPCSSGGCSAGGDAAGEGGGFGGAPMPPCGVGWGARAAAAAAAAAGPATDETRKATNKREKESSPPQPKRVVGRVSVETLREAGPNGRVYGGVQCPSMKDLWPEVYSAAAVRVVQVDLRVEIRSRSGDFLHLDSELKVIYRRPQDHGSSEGASWRP